MRSLILDPRLYSWIEATVVSQFLCHNLAQWAKARRNAEYKKAKHRRSAIEPAIGHMKNEGRLRRNWNWLKGALGDAMHAMLVVQVTTYG